MGGEESEARSGPGPNCVPGQEPLAGAAADHCKELIDVNDIGKLLVCQRWYGPFAVTACLSPNACTLALQRQCRLGCAAARQSMSTG
jgi:hypothetical protein